MQLTKLQKLRFIQTKGNCFSVDDMLNRSCKKRAVPLNQLKYKILTPQIHFQTLTNDNRIQPVHYLVKHETLLASQKDGCYPVLADFGNDHFSFRIFDAKENILTRFFLF